jgi:hypothetical protein
MATPVRDFGSKENLQAAEAVLQELRLAYAKSPSELGKKTVEAIEAGRIKTLMAYTKNASPVFVVRATFDSCWDIRPSAASVRLQRNNRELGALYWQLKPEEVVTILKARKEYLEEAIRNNQSVETYRNVIGPIFGEVPPSARGTSPQVTLTRELQDTSLRLAGLGHGIPEEKKSEDDANGQLTGWQDDSEACEAALLLVREIEKFRGNGAIPADGAAAERLIRQFCSRLRRSGAAVSLARVAQLWHLDDREIVAVSAVLLGYLGARIDNEARSIANLAYGYSPIESLLFRGKILEEKGVGQLLSLNSNHLAPTGSLLMTVMPPMDNDDWELCRNQIRSLPQLDKKGTNAPEEN